jgi:hypothetical protein
MRYNFVDNGISSKATYYQHSDPQLDRSLYKGYKIASKLKSELQDDLKTPGRKPEMLIFGVLTTFLGS